MRGSNNVVLTTVARCGCTHTLNLVRRLGQCHHV